MVSTLDEQRAYGGPATHDVTNQAPPLAPYDASEDTALLEGLRREGAGWAAEDLRRLGRQAGSVQAQEWADLANRHEPELRTHDRYGNRVDEVEFHPSWHHLMRTAIAGGLAASPGRTTGPAPMSPGPRADWCGGTRRRGTAARRR
ncbi:putative acyl-CoA dehydrogenase AidB [Streptomyces afghaniensis 772]|uniref:Putative acyl-CoA dehydrogenase AidB n=1 Tax=Streptomyces afghaniensis 772 TaxID=1283301 RepID=S4N0Z8_9ACTN|nr:putative acyl-CoA dehydrogenase AidB [Streptomyces afghaniensis 772]